MTHCNASVLAGIALPLAVPIALEAPGAIRFGRLR